MIYYKVVNHLLGEVTIDTQRSNYSQTMTDIARHKRLLDIITHSSEAYNFPLDVYFTLNNNIAIWGNSYLERFPAAINGYYDLGHLCTSENMKSLFIKQRDLVKFIDDIDQNGIYLFDEGYYLWEYIYEKARTIDYPTAPARHESLFLFENKHDCEYYINKHKGFGTICEVRILKTKALLRVDMNILDEIPNNFTYKEAFVTSQKYWSGQKSKNAVMETLFQGECMLRRLS
jgi:hypothetical protein